MSNTITIELCQEDRKRLDEVVAFLGLLVGQQKSQTPAPAAPVTPAAENPAPVVDFPVVDDETPFDPPAAPEPAKEPETPKVTLDEIQALVVKLASPDGGKRDQVRTIVKEYAARVGLIPEDKFPEVWEKLTALAKEG